MRITVFGATGRTGRPLVEQALAAGHEVVAFARDRDDLTGVHSHDRLTVVEGDAYTGVGVPEAVSGADAVVGVLGQTGDGPDDLLTVAGDNVMSAMTDAGVDRLVTLVGTGVRRPGDSVSLGGRLMNAALGLLAGEVLADAKAHVDQVTATELDWTVVRPPRLTERPATGEYRHGSLALGVRDSISRADLAAFVLETVETGAYVRAAPMVAG